MLTRHTGIRSDTIIEVNAAQMVREVRRRSRLGLRELARRADTSHATLHAYSAGTKEPRFDTVMRIADAAGFVVEIELAPRVDSGPAREAKARELVDALTLAAIFPARPTATLEAPIFGRAA